MSDLGELYTGDSVEDSTCEDTTQMEMAAVEIHSSPKRKLKSRSRSASAAGLQDMFVPAPKDAIAAAKNKGEMLARDKVWTAADFDFEVLRADCKSSLIDVPDVEVRIRRIPRATLTTSSVPPGEIGTLETHVQDSFKFYSGDWSVLIREDVQYRLAKPELLSTLTDHPSEADVIVSLTSLRQGSLKENKTDNLEADLSLLRPPSYTRTLPTPQVRSWFSLFHPTFDWGRGICQKVGNIDFSARNDPSGVVFSRPDSIDFIIEPKRPFFSLGDIEPWFSGIALYDLREKSKISETFHFTHINDERATWLRLKQSDTEPRIDAGTFFVTRPSRDIVLVQTLCRVLQGSISKCNEPYIRPLDSTNNAQKRLIQKVKDRMPLLCDVVGDFHQIFAFSYTHVFGAGGAFTIDGKQEFNPFYVLEPGETICDAISAVVDQKRRKSIVGSAAFIATRIVAQEKPAMSRLDQAYGTYHEGCDENPPFTRDMMSLVPPLRAYPLRDYVNVLFVYPVSLTFASDRKITDICVTMEYRSSDKRGSEAEPVLYSDNGCGMTTRIRSHVFYKNRNPIWTEITEFKVKLPLRLNDRAHLFFTISEVDVEGAKKSRTKKGSVETVIGYSFLKLYENNHLLPPDTEAGGGYTLPIVKKDTLPEETLPVFYLTKMQKGELPLWEGGKPLLKLQALPISSVMSKNPTLSSLFRNYHLKEFFGDDDLTSCLEGIPKVPEDDIIKQLPVVLGGLIRCACVRGGKVGVLTFEALISVVDKVQSSQGIAGDPRVGLINDYVSYTLDEGTAAKVPIYLGITKHFLTHVMLSNRGATSISTRQMFGNCWVVFDIIIKSLVLCSEAEEPRSAGSPRGKQFDPDFARLLIKLFSMLVKLLPKSDLNDVGPPEKLNSSMMLFVTDLFRVFDRGIAIGLFVQHIEALDKAIAGESNPVKAECLTLWKLDAVKIVSDYTYFVSLNLPKPLEISRENIGDLTDILSERHPLADACIKAAVDELAKNVALTQRALAVSTLTNLIAKIDLDARYHSPEAKAEVAVIFFPLLTRMCEKQTQLESWLSGKPGSADKVGMEKRRLQERREMYSNVVWLLSHFPREQLRNWWRYSPFEDVSFFLWLMRDLLIAFQYVPGHCELATPFHTTSTEIFKLVDPNSNSKDLDKRRNRLSRRRDSYNLDDEEILNFRGRQLSYHSFLLAQSILEDMIEDFGRELEYRVPAHRMSDQLFLMMLSCLSTFSPLENLRLGFDTLYKWCHQHGKFLFMGHSNYLGLLIDKLLRILNSDTRASRLEGTAFFFFLLTLNVKHTGSFGVVANECTTQLSTYAESDDFGSGNALENSLQVLSQYAMRHYAKVFDEDDEFSSFKGYSIGDSSAGFSSSEEDENVDDNFDPQYGNSVFVHNIQTLSRTLIKIAQDMVEVRERQATADPESMASMYWRIAEGYIHTPELRKVWLERLSQYHSRNEDYPEAAIAMCHVAALVADFLNNFTDEVEIPTHIFHQIIPDLNEFADFTQDQATIKFFQEAEMFEFAAELHKVLLPIYHRERSYRDLGNTHKQLQGFFQKLAETNTTRLLGMFYRIGFYGARFGELNGREFVYKEPALTHLYELTERMKTHYEQECYDEGSLIILKHSGKVDLESLDPLKGYLQITSLATYFDEEELSKRPTFFQKHSILNRFYYDTPFIQGGKVGQAATEDQFMRKTILTTAHTFPHLEKRIEIRSVAEVVLSPIEIAVGAMQTRIEKIQVELDRQPPDTKTLQQVLQGSVLTTVNRGTIEYLEIFLAQAEKWEPDGISALRHKFRGFLHVAKKALILNGAIIDESQNEFHGEMENGYRDLCSQVFPHIAGLEDGLALAESTLAPRQSSSPSVAEIISPRMHNAADVVSPLTGRPTPRAETPVGTPILSPHKERKDAAGTSPKKLAKRGKGSKRERLKRVNSKKFNRNSALKGVTSPTSTPDVVSPQSEPKKLIRVNSKKFDKTQVPTATGTADKKSKKSLLVRVNSKRFNRGSFDK